MSKKYDLSVIVPFYNEEKFLVESVERLLSANLFKEIILVNDCSNDRSPQIARKLVDKYENISLHNLKENSGKGNAIKVGLNFVKSKYTIIHDADLEYYPSDIKQMIIKTDDDENCLVIGSRTLRGGSRNNRYRVTYFANKYFTYFFSLINFHYFTDIASCYWLIKTETLRSLDIKEKGFAIEVEVISKFLRTGYKVYEVPINYSGRLYSEGKKIRLSDGINIFFKILQYSRLFNPFKRI